MRGVLQSPGGELPFVLSDLRGASRLHHGEDWIPISTNPSAAGCEIPFPPYDSRIVARWLDPQAGSSGLAGTWTKNGPNGPTSMPFRCHPWPRVPDPDHPDHERNAPLFPLAGEPLDVTGRWRVRFQNDPHPAVAIFGRNRGPFVQVPGEITGTFLTVTGDYRFLAGTARGDQLRLACFDGAHAFLFAARRQEDGTLRGDFWSGTAWHETWTAERDDAAALPDAFTLTKATDAALAALRFPDPTAPEGAEPVRIGDHLGKVTLVVLFGTWCPNCGDAGPFLRELQEQYGERGLRVLGLAFEHGTDPVRHRQVLAAYRERHGARWPILLAGSSDKKQASAAFPVLDAVRAFPTTLFVDATGTVRAVHQGFAGPAAPKEHRAQRLAFTALVDRLLAEAKR